MFLLIILGIFFIIYIYFNADEACESVKRDFKELEIILGKCEEIKSNKSQYIGEKVKVIGKLSNNKYRVKIFSEEWTGISSEILEIRETVNVISIDGNKFILGNKM